MNEDDSIKLGVAASPADMDRMKASFAKAESISAIDDALFQKLDEAIAALPAMVAAAVRERFAADDEANLPLPMRGRQR